MSTPPILASRAEMGSIQLVRFGLRCAQRVAPTGAEAPPTHDVFVAASAAASHRVGDQTIRVECRRHGESATLALELHNPSGRTLQVESVVVGLRWNRPQPGPLRFLRHGWQSWSFTGVRDLDEAGEPEFPSGEWLRGMHHAVGSPPADRAGWHESDTVTVAGSSPAGAACLVGVLERGECFGSVYLRSRSDEALDLEVELRLEVPVEPGETRQLDAVRVALDRDASRLLEAFAQLWGHEAGARTRAPFQAGWCSWYHFFHAVRESDLLRNLEVLARDRADFPVDVVQLDDGYQRQIGDWLETNEKFPRGLAPIAADIRAAGFVPGLWTAPFCAVPESRVAEQHPDWLLRNGEELFLGLLHPEWSPTARVHALDTTREEVIAHLESTYAALVEMGFEYLKLDFLHAVAMRADAFDSRVTRAARLRNGLLAVRRGAGEEAFLLGCGCPLGPAVGVVDGMRIGPDVAPSWETDSPIKIPGLEPALPSLASALRSVLYRAWMHRRLWINDPDCLMARSQDTKLQPEEVHSMAAVFGASGGMLVISDDLPMLGEEGRRWVRETIGLAREVDAADRRGVARLAAFLDPGAPTLTMASIGCDVVVAAVNTGDAPVAVEWTPALLGLAASATERQLLRPAQAAPTDTLAPHASMVARFDTARPLAVFCDFDGTFSVQDVGSTLARARLPERRALLWARYELGELTPWEYSVELLNGFELPERDLFEFLQTIDLDEGARDLLSWCDQHEVPFRVLSDGFDYNLDRLKKIHDMRFEYDANQLRYEGDHWRIAPGAPNPDCSCGTGTCKRGRIDQWRAAHPGALCVHIGNGRVSDLCGAMEADRAYAKDTLAPALVERGIAFEPFRTLLDVVSDLGRFSPS